MSPAVVSGGNIAVISSSGCDEVLLHLGVVISTLFFNASISVQNNYAHSTYPIGMEILNTASCSSEVEAHHKING